MRLAFAAALAASLAACGPLLPRADAGRHFTIEHSGVRYDDAMEGARQHCAAMGMRAKHLGSDIGFMHLSRFECVKE